MLMFIPIVLHFNAILPYKVHHVAKLARLFIRYMARKLTTTHDLHLLTYNRAIL
jgi:hypothetical protein